MSTKIKLTCQKCKKLLQIPSTAIGHKVRCPACRHTFEVPKPKEKTHSDDSIANWIFDDVEDEIDEKLSNADQRIAKFKPTSTASDKDERAKRTQDRLESVLSGRDPGLPTAPGASQESAASSSATAQEESELEPPPLDDASDATPKPETPTPSQPAPAAREPMPQIPQAAAQAVVQAAQGYPDNIHVTSPIPHMVIREVTHHGVLVAFDATWLDHMGFRASMPIRCIFTGDTNRSDLFVRPLAFLDRSGARIRAASDMRQGHGMRLLESIATRDLVRGMPVIEAMIAPFGNPMPYYVSTAAADREVECTTRNRPEGGITCEVLVPDLHYALDWLGRVNGICGAEYELLEQDLKLLASDSWGMLPVKTRERLENWIKFLPRERFKIYLNDAEFGQKDAGLAGIAVTDHRLLYRKYHRNGEAALSEPSKLLFKAEADFTSVSLENSEGRTRIGMLRVDDVPRLIQAVSHASGMTIEKV